tara:strand:- start:143 stop:271 length:129 start_codon:yes stop_codon:yes gene_type:complete
MDPKTEYLVELIYSKLKNQKAKKISLSKQELKKFIASLLKET